MKNLFYTIFFLLLLAGCGGGKENTTEKSAYAPPTASAEKKVSDDPMQNKGVGPITEMTLGELDHAMADQGAEIFTQKCSACHKVDKKFIGPSPKDILERRSPEWVMNMILNPEEMLQKDPIAKQLLAEANGAPMANQNLTEEEARKVLEYFRTL